MINFSHTEDLFLKLYRSGVWEEPLELNSFTNREIDWKGILRLAKQQTVIGCLADGIAELPESAIPQKTYASLLSWAVVIQQNNARMNAILPGLFTELETHGIRTWLLKGQGVGINYIHPQSRQSGDIDLFIMDRADFRKANELMRTRLQLIDDYSETYLHAAYIDRGILIELHGDIVGRINHKTNSRLNSWYRQFVNDFEDRSITIGNGKVKLPPINFDALFIFIHLVRHYFGGGIGLRQVTDWMRFLYVMNDQIDQDRLYKDIKYLGLNKVWSVFGTMAVDFLGCPQEVMPLYNPQYAHQGRRILRYILDSGNFGFHDQRTKSNSRYYYIRRFKAFTGHIQMMFRNIIMFPKEAFYSLPYFLKDGLQRTFANRKANK